jgi:predicted GNAT family acetyltransferase
MAEVTDNSGQSRFEISVDGELAGSLSYQRGKGTIALIHTEIEPSFEGEGLGSQLIRGALDQARAEGLAVLPFCPFVRSYIGDHAEYLDLVPEDRRAEFELA